MDYVQAHQQILADLTDARATEKQAQDAYAVAAEVYTTATARAGALARLAAELSQFPEVLAAQEP